MPNSKITDLTSLTTPTDNDVTVIVDVLDTSQSSTGTDKKLSWANIKATLKTYFDSLYLGLHAKADTAGAADTATTAFGSTLDTDGTLAANSDTKIPSQKAVKTYADTKLPTSLKAVGSDVTTGTEDTKYVTSKAIKDSTALPRYTDAGFFVGTFTRDQTLTGDVAYTGVGFKPRAVIFILKPAVTDNTRWSSIGFDNQSVHKTLNQKSNAVSISDFAFFTGDAATWDSEAIIKTLDNDGFTLTYTKTGTPTAGSYTVIYLALR